MTEKDWKFKSGVNIKWINETDRVATRERITKILNNNRVNKSTTKGK